MIAFQIFCVVAILWSIAELAFCTIKIIKVDYEKPLIALLWDKWVANENKIVHGFINTKQDRNKTK